TAWEVVICLVKHVVPKRLLFWPSLIRFRHRLQTAMVRSAAHMSKKANTKELFKISRESAASCTCGALRCDAVGWLPLSCPLEDILPRWSCASSSSLRHPSRVSDLIIPSLLVTGANLAVCCGWRNMTASFLFSWAPPISRLIMYLTLWLNSSGDFSVHDGGAMEGVSVDKELVK
ncbi:hypothetical protein AB205_0143120, partial [Aquarana catesbeiana]